MRTNQPATAINTPDGLQLPIESLLRSLGPWGPPGASKPTEIRLPLDLPSGPLVVRLTEPLQVDMLIATLARFRNQVWGGRPGAVPITGEGQ